MEKQRKEKVFRYGLFCAAALVVSPVIFMVVQGIIGLAIAAVVLATIVTFTPVVSMKLANWKLKAIKAEASANPIETLQNQWVEKSNQLSVMASAVTAFLVETKNYQGKVSAFTKRYPDRADEFRRQADNMQKVADLQKVRLTQSQAKLADFQNQIEEASAVWDMTQASAAAMKSMSKFSNEDVLEKIKSQTAIDSVTRSLNAVMAELETALAMDYTSNEVQVLTNSPTESVPLNVVSFDKVAR